MQKVGISEFGNFNEVGITKTLRRYTKCKKSGTTNKSSTKLKFRWQALSMILTVQMYGYISIIHFTNTT